MAIEGDYDQYVKNSHEEAMKDTRVRIARIEADRDIRTTKINAKYNLKKATRTDSDRTFAMCVIAFFLVVAVIVLCITYGSTRTKSPEEIQDKRERYELCMSFEKDEAKC